ncbi:MAG: AAA family ATPase [Tissierella sp.]|uniref:AAA family ATPase n=1 Tax=Tissierella sp. TaxID=41274 RepID=UPI003F956302
MYNLNDKMVRILEVSLSNYKNVSKGRVEMGNILNIEDEKGDILGIYGQNGSGKTSIISAVNIIKDIFSGDSLPKDIDEYIMSGKEEMEIDILFFIKDYNKRYKVKYNVVFFKDNMNTFIKEESIYYWYKEAEATDWNRIKGLVGNRYNEKYMYPKYRNEELIKVYDKAGFLLDKKKEFENRKSLIFSEKFIGKIAENSSSLGEEYEILNILQKYARSNLFIIDNKKTTLNYANILVPIKNKKNEDIKHTPKKVLEIGMGESVYLRKEVVFEIEDSLQLANKVISEIIPELEIKIKELKTQDDKVLIELLACRDGREIPMKYESDGIKKIVAVIHLLIAMFNNRSITVLIDELDAGIFEFLLGEIIEILEERGKGQLIFTSHNLRPLEILNKNNLVFTTTNINNRYIKLKNVKTNNNLRDMYYRDLVLGGQDEEIYDTTKSAKIARAFRKAGR